MSMSIIHQLDSGKLFKHPKHEGLTFIKIGNCGDIVFKAVAGKGNDRFNALVVRVNEPHRWNKGKLVYLGTNDEVEIVE